MEEKQFHNQVYWITFLFSLLVVWVHSFNAELYLGAMQAAAGVKRLEWILGEGLGQISVPGFFMVSSYLFYRRFNWSRLLPKWKSRIRSILVPYLIWNVLYYAGYVAATRIPAISGLIGKPPVPVTIMQSVDALVNYAYNPVFWYLYQLILLIALAPVVYPVMKRTLTGAAALGVIAFALWHGWDFPHLNMDALFYTCGAAYISLHRDGWGRFAESLPPRGGRRVLCWGAAVLLLALVLFLSRPMAPLYARPLSAVWFLLSGLPLPMARDWMKHNFFLYAIHFAWVRLFNKAGAILLPPVPASALSMFLLMPLFMVIISSLLRKCLQSVVPGVYRVLSGNR